MSVPRKTSTLRSASSARFRSSREGKAVSIAPVTGKAFRDLSDEAFPIEHLFKLR